MAVGFEWVFKWPSVDSQSKSVWRCCMKCSVEKGSDVVGGDRLVMSAMDRDRVT